MSDNSTLDTESRWPAVVVLLLVISLISSLPDRYRIVPPWFPLGAIVLTIGSMMGVTFAPGSRFWRTAERWVVIVLCVLSTISNVASIVILTTDMIVGKHNISSVSLLESAVTLWTNNLLVFALLYWQLDRSDPETVVNKRRKVAADFAFTEAGDPMAAGWKPTFVDYLFLAFTASTSFSAPDHSRPTGHRAKLLLMIQATISLVTLFLIAARAIGTLS